MSDVTTAGANRLMEDESEDGSEASRGKPRKAPNAFRTISEVADDLHIPQHVLRFWETKFPQVKPLKRGGGRRYYRPDDIALLRRISDLLYIQGYTIKGVQRLLREGGGKLSDEIPPPTADEQAEMDALHEADEPPLAMPGLSPATATHAPSRAPRAAMPAELPHAAAEEVPSLSANQASEEVERLQAILAHTLAELEALRALL
jgi:DNA-binding transcriptional MerR regulator